MAVVTEHNDIRAAFAMVVGARISQARRKLGISQAQLARELRVGHSTTVTYWEAGRNCPPSYLLATLADILEIELNDLLRM